MIPDFIIDTFRGINTTIKDLKVLKPGFSPDSKNWITSKEKDSISLRRGYARLGLTEVTGSGKITGLGVGIRYNGVEIPFFSYLRKIKYYDVATDDNIEVGTNLLPTGASGEDVWFQAYQSLAGSFVYFGSPNSSVYKVPTANPASAVDQLVASYRFGVFHIGQNRSFAGQRKGTTAGNEDKTGLFLSYIDKSLLSSFTQVTGESYGTGDGTTKTFAKTLTAITGVRTAMYPSVTDGTETFIDDRNGNMVGNLGGTGTINYATGAMSVTFNTAPASPQAITCSYYHETSTTAGILDYSGSANGQGKSFRQDDGGGNLMAVFNLYNIEYCFHLLKTWQFTATLDDTTSTNLVYRNIGIPYSRSAWQTPEGIIFIDMARPAEPKFRRLQVLQGTTNTTIEPVSLSDGLDLSGYSFDYAVAYRWGDYEIFCVAEKINGVANTFNSVMLIRNVVSGAWDILDYYASCLATYGGTLIAGDSVSNNIYTLFSGYDEDGGIVSNYWTSSDLDLGTKDLKTCRRMVIDGLIQKDQDLKVSLAYDGGAFSDIYTILGDGSYVDTGIHTTIGSPTIGSKVIGGGGSDTASPFEIDFPVNSDRFIYVRIKVEAIGIGYAQINEFIFKDIREKGRKNLPSRIV